jgi:hypothetical protein
MAPPWSLSRRILFRFVCSYLVLYCMPGDDRTNVLSWIPGSETLAKPWTLLIQAICPWIAIHIFHLTGKPTTYFPTGSGDTTLAWIENGFFVLAALVATVLWSILDRKRPDYRTAHNWLRLLVRYTLAFTLFSYGFVKIAPLQFQPARFSRLVEPYGDFSPMGVLWSFMGASLPYIVLAGSAEVLGGLLLLFRRTTTLGALISFGVLANVVALNYCYDVPVKLYSTNLLLMCVFLAAPDLRRLASVFVLNRVAGPADSMAVIFERRGLRIAATVCWVLLVGRVLTAEIIQAREGYLRTYVTAKHPPVYGLYDVEAFRLNGTYLENAWDPARWRKAWFIDSGFGIRTMTDQVTTYPGKFDTSKGVLAMNDGVGSIAWTIPDSEHLAVEGKVRGDAIYARLRKIDTSKLLLNSRGFHWISETPYNR